MIDRFFRSVKRNSGALTGFTVSSIGSIVGVILGFDAFVHRMAVYYADQETSINIKEVDKHNKEYPDDLWEYEHFSIEDTIDSA